MARAALLALLLLAATAAAAPTPTGAIREVFRRADAILTDGATRDRPLERLTAIRKLVNEAFDFRAAAELASGDHWQARTLAEQEEFTWLFGDLLERSFLSRMAAEARLEGGTEIRYLAESVEGRTAFVQTAMARRDGGQMHLDYRLVERDGTWRIRDVFVDGVSVMANYRAQLDRVLSTTSFPDLLTQMRAKVGSGGPPSVPRTRAYWIRVSTHDSAEEAGRLVARLLKRDPTVSLERTIAAGKRVVHVRIGPFRDMEDAVLKLLDLQAGGWDPYVVAERE
jgi:phospholipid transport system substrate-binding protein